MPKIPQNTQLEAKEHTRGDQHGKTVARFGTDRPRRGHEVYRCEVCIANVRAQVERPSIAVQPGSGLEKLLGVLKRAERRLLLAAVQTTNPKRRARMQREFQRRATIQGIRP